MKNEILVAANELSKVTGITLSSIIRFIEKEAKQRATYEDVSEGRLKRYSSKIANQISEKELAATDLTTFEFDAPKSVLAAYANTDK